MFKAHENLKQFNCILANVVVVALLIPIVNVRLLYNCWSKSNPARRTLSHSYRIAFSRRLLSAFVFRSFALSASIFSVIRRTFTESSGHGLAQQLSKTNTKIFAGNWVIDAFVVQASLPAATLYNRRTAWHTHILCNTIIIICTCILCCEQAFTNMMRISWRCLLLFIYLYKNIFVFVYVDMDVFVFF